MGYIEKIKDLTQKLNYYRDKYYNDNESVISDYEYDNLFDELKRLEEKHNFYMSNSPCKTVGYEIKSSLPRSIHSHEMLSLDKTKSLSDLVKFVNKKNCLISLKLDGLTILLTYDNGELLKAETRGNGIEGEVITHNVKVFDNIPLKINYKGRLEVEGEAIITYKDFDNINKNLEVKFKNPRNLVSGSVRQLNSKIVAGRHIKFIVWKVPYIESEIDGKDNFCSRLRFVKNLGFEIVPLLRITPLYYFDNETIETKINKSITWLKAKADEYKFPIDGLVTTYEDISYGECLGKTGHHPKHSLAYKFYDEVEEATIKEIEWSIGKIGALTPVAIFTPVELDGTVIERASVHNVSVLKQFDISVGDIVEVYKANQIIPQIKTNISYWQRQKSKCIIPDTCPVCGSSTYIKKSENLTEVLMCSNKNCKGVLLAKCVYFVSKNGVNIEGMSEALLCTLINKGYIKNLTDIYKLGKYKNAIADVKGFSKKSIDKFLDRIEKSKNITLEKFINALSIPMIGKDSSSTISKFFGGDFNKMMKAWESDNFNWGQIKDFGASTHMSMVNYIAENKDMVKELASYMNFTTHNISDSAILANKIFVITGTLKKVANRDKLKNIIEMAGGKVVDGVSKQTTYLINNNINSKSTKNIKAKELNIPIISENEFFDMLNGM